jgi:hypothetical protein
MRGVPTKSLPKKAGEYGDYLGEMFDIGPLDSALDILATPGIRNAGEELTEQQLRAVSEALSNPATREAALRRLSLQPGGGIVTNQVPEVYSPRAKGIGIDRQASSRALFGNM